MECNQKNNISRVNMTLLAGMDQWLHVYSIMWYFAFSCLPQELSICLLQPFCGIKLEVWPCQKTWTANTWLLAIKHEEETRNQWRRRLAIQEYLPPTSCTANKYSQGAVLSVINRWSVIWQSNLNKPQVSYAIKYGNVQKF